MSLISEEDPIFRELGHVSAEMAGSLVGVAALGNAFGRVFWAWASDFLTRRVTFAAIFVIEAAILAIFPSLHSTAGLTAAAFLVLVCFGGSVGTMPAFAADCFGPLNVGSIYGAMLMLGVWEPSPGRRCSPKSTSAPGATGLRCTFWRSWRSRRRSCRL